MGSAKVSALGHDWREYWREIGARPASWLPERRLRAYVTILSMVTVSGLALAGSVIARAMLVEA